MYQGFLKSIVCLKNEAFCFYDMKFVLVIFSSSNLSTYCTFKCLKTVSWFILKRILFKTLKEKVFSLNRNKNNMRKPYVVLWGPWLNSPYFVVWLVGWFMVFNATFNNISVISWRSFLLVEETGVPGENHCSVASHSNFII